MTSSSAIIDPFIGYDLPVHSTVKPVPDQSCSTQHVVRFSQVRSTPKIPETTCLSETGPLYSFHSPVQSRAARSRLDPVGIARVVQLYPPLDTAWDIHVLAFQSWKSTREVSSGRQPGRFLWLFSSTHAPHLTQAGRGDSPEQACLYSRFWRWEQRLLPRGRRAASWARRSTR